MPCFLTKSYIPPFIASVANLCCNLDESPFISEDGGNSISNGAAVAISISEPKELGKLPVLEIGSVK